MPPVDRISVIAITKNGVKIASRLKGTPGCRIYAPAKLDTGDAGIEWYQEPTSAKIGSLFEAGGALVCLFSLGAVIRLIAPHMKSKKTDPAVIVIDDGANFVISVLSGHIGGANRLTVDLAGRLGATAVITTAADVNRTVAVDMVGREFGWEIEDDSTVTRVSAMMVNAEKIGLLQEAGERKLVERPASGEHHPVLRHGGAGGIRLHGPPHNIGRGTSVRPGELCNI